MKAKFLLVVSFLFAVVCGWAQQGGKLKMWYDKPATVWNEALPIGNGTYRGNGIRRSGQRKNCNSTRVRSGREARSRRARQPPMD